MRICVTVRALPSAEVYPRLGPEMQAVFQVAATSAAPIWPVGAGKDRGDGERSAACDRGITVILARMNRIIQVGEQLRHAVNEPGMTDKQLDDHLKLSGSGRRADCAGGTQTARLIGLALDSGHSLTPVDDHDVCKWGVAPYVGGLLVQTNQGAVVRTGIWLMPAPEVVDFVAFEDKADPSRLGVFIDGLHELVMLRSLRSHPHLPNNIMPMCNSAQSPTALLGGRRHLSDEAAAQWSQAHGVARSRFGTGTTAA